MDSVYNDEYQPIECAEEGIIYKKKKKNIQHPYVLEIIGGKYFYQETQNALNKIND